MALGALMRLEALLCVLFLSGCVPWPHFSNLTPGVTGTLPVRSGQPLFLVASVDAAKPCTGKASESETTEDGFFYMRPVREFNGFLVVMGHGFFPWALCTKREGSWVPVHTKREYTLVDTGPALLIRLTCTQAAQCEEENIWNPSEQMIEELEARAKE